MKNNIINENYQCHESENISNNVNNISKISAIANGINSAC